MTQPATPDAPETQTVATRKIACDGGAGGNHPRVWLTIPDATGSVVCPYCGARYVYAEADDAAA